jgi:hypothetical protein
LIDRLGRPGIAGTGPATGMIGAEIVAGRARWPALYLASQTTHAVAPYGRKPLYDPLRIS